MSVCTASKAQERALLLQRGVNLQNSPLICEGGICRGGQGFWNTIPLSACEHLYHCGDGSSGIVPPCSQVKCSQSILTHQSPKCLFLNYFQDLRRQFLMSQAPSSLSDWLRAAELPVRTEPSVKQECSKETQVTTGMDLTNGPQVSQIRLSFIVKDDTSDPCPQILTCE